MGKKRHSKEECTVAEKKRKLREYSSPSSSENEIQEKKVKEKRRSRHKHKSKKKKRKVKSDSSSISGSSDQESSSSLAEKKRKKKHKKKEKRIKSGRKKHNSKPGKEVESSDSESIRIGPLPPENINEKARSMAPLTKEEWEKRQSVVRRVYDEETGRHRLIKGDGEVLEEIVSRDRHKEINRQATTGDGSFFQNKIQHKLKNL